MRKAHSKFGEFSTKEGRSRSGGIGSNFACGCSAVGILANGRPQPATARSSPAVCAQMGLIATGPRRCKMQTWFGSSKGRACAREECRLGQNLSDDNYQWRGAGSYIRVGRHEFRQPTVNTRPIRSDWSLRTLSRDGVFRLLRKRGGHHVEIPLAPSKRNRRLTGVQRLRRHSVALLCRR